MIAPVRATRVRQFAAALAVLCAATIALGWPAEAQVGPAPASGTAASGFPTPVAIAISVLNGQVLCRPETLRLPARAGISLHVINRSRRPVMFAAPKFFQASEGMQAHGAVYNPDRGGFLVEASNTLPVLLRTPPAGEYYYACYQLGEVSTVQGTGFIVVGPAAPGKGGQASPRR